MPKVIPVPDELSKPFWDAVNAKRLVLQHCTGCDKRHIATDVVIEDGRLNRRMPDQPYNLAMVTLDQDPTINFYSNLPGTPPYEVPVGNHGGNDFINIFPHNQFYPDASVDHLWMPT